MFIFLRSLLWRYICLLSCSDVPVYIAVKCTYGEPCALIAQARFWEGPGPTDVQLIVLLEKPVYSTIKYD